jgi:hypothetical protein
MSHKVKLTLFQDDATGEFGLAHHNATDRGDGTDFNAFWDGIGIFHDVFEHWFEGEHEYFMDENGFNIGGEMAAMGAMIYYYYELGVHNRPIGRNIHGMEAAAKQTTLIECEESIRYGYTRYGHELNCGVPDQAPVYSGSIEYIAESMTEELLACPIETDYEQEKEDAIRFQNSITFQKIANLHRWGFCMAENLIPDNRHNQDTLMEFIDFWNEFCEKNNAEEIMNDFSGVEFTITKNEDGEIYWKAEFQSNYPSELNNWVIDSNMKCVPSQEDIYELYTIED